MWQMNPLIYPILVAGFIALVPFITIIRKKRWFPGRDALYILLIAISFWSFAYALELASVGLSGKLIWNGVKYLGIVTIPVAWLCFVIAYTGHREWLSSLKIILLAIIPVITITLAWTNPYYHQFYTRIWLETNNGFTMKATVHGPGYWLNFAYDYLLLIIGMVMIIRAFLHSPKLYRSQTSIILVAAVIPIISNLLYNLGINPFPHFDMSPLAFTLTGLLVSWAIIRYQLFDIIPIAHDIIIENMEDAVIVQDEWSRILAINPAGQRILGCSASAVIGKTSADLRVEGNEQIKQYLEAYAVSDEVQLTINGTTQYFDLRISPLNDRRQHMIGRIVSLHNITDRKQIEEMLRKSEEKYKALSVTDALTKLYNVRHFYTQLDNEIALAQRHGTPLSLLLFDIDDFKHFNDAWGHVEGDKVLAAMGEVLRLTMRKTDNAFRYGGEEFTVILSSTSGQNAQIVAEKLRSSFHEHPFPIPGGQVVHLSISIGVAQLRPQDNLQSFLQRADRNMYAAKREGKNRIFYSDSERI